MPRPCKIRKQLNEFLFFFILVITIQQNFLEMCRSFLQLMKFHWILGLYWYPIAYWVAKTIPSLHVFDHVKNDQRRYLINSILLLEICYYRNIFLILPQNIFLYALKTTAVVIGTYYIPNYMQIFFKGMAVNVVLFCTQKVIGAQLPPLFKQCFSWIKERASFGYWFCMN